MSHRNRIRGHQAELCLHEYLKKQILTKFSGRSGCFMRIVEREKWYLLIECANCERGSVLCEAASLTDTESTTKAFSWRCPYCGDKGIYRPEQVQRLQGIYV
jgi:predicted RNA-binding Zn-ribbon protein involved in translation (DUF1610 family)